MKKKFLSLTLLVSLLTVTSASAFTDNNVKSDNNVQNGEEIIMTGFNIKDSVISRMIDADWPTIQAEHHGNLIIPREINKIPLSAFPDNALFVCKKLHDAGYQAYIIGGAVRDMIMDKKADDADIVTDADINQMKEIFRDSLLTHKVGDGTFCLVKTFDGVVDLSPMSACPQLYIDKGLLKPIPFKTVLADSFERDLPFNAIYYDPFTGNIIDYRGGLKDIRDNNIHSTFDPEIELTAVPGTPVIRLLRFKAKYGYTFDARLDSALTADAPHLQSYCAKNGLYSSASKMFLGGYGMKCYNLLEQYKIFQDVFPCTKIIKNQKAYKKWLVNKLEENDSIINSGVKLGRAYVVACIMYPAYKQLRKKLDSAEATKQVLEEQKKVMLIWDEKKILKTFERLYNEETTKK